MRVFASCSGNGFTNDALDFYFVLNKVRVASAFDCMVNELYIDGLIDRLNARLGTIQLRGHKERTVSHVQSPLWTSNTEKSQCAIRVTRIIPENCI